MAAPGREALGDHLGRPWDASRPEKLHVRVLQNTVGGTGSPAAMWQDGSVQKVRFGREGDSRTSRIWTYMTHGQVQVKVRGVGSTVF